MLHRPESSNWITSALGLEKPPNNEQVTWLRWPELKTKMCIFYEKKHMSLIHNILLCISSFFVRMVTFETYSHFIYVKGNTKHSNEWKYKSHQQKKNMHPPIWKFCFSWRFYQVVLASKECIEFLFLRFAFSPNKLQMKSLACTLSTHWGLNFIYNCDDGDSSCNI